jgi:hypothetical protein
MNPTRQYLCNNVRQTLDTAINVREIEKLGAVTPLRIEQMHLNIYDYVTM